VLRLKLQEIFTVQKDQYFIFFWWKKQKCRQEFSCLY